jgi:hypothetical protein
MTAAVWHPVWCSPARCTAFRDGHSGEHHSELVRVAANTQWVEVDLYLATNPYAVAWIVLTAGPRKFMLAPAEAQRLGMAIVDLAYAETRRHAKDATNAARLQFRPIEAPGDDDDGGGDGDGDV